MLLHDFEQGPIRPPSEAKSLLIRTTRGCSWNRCHFCTLFKEKRFSIRPVEEIKKDIVKARECYREIPFESCFLQDGDSFAMKTKNLIEVLTCLKQAFPSLKQISSYGRAQSMQRKSETEMKEIFDAGLNMLYSGIESGSDEVLETVQKGVTADAIVKSSIKASRAGMRLMVFVILGLGGKDLSQEHIHGTAKVLNQINPDEIRIMSLAVKPDTELANQMKKGSFSMLSEVEMVKEQRQLIRQLDGIHSRYGNFHGINLLTELVGILPDDKPKLLATIDHFLSLGEDEKFNFILGVRTGRYRSLSDFKNSSAFSLIQTQIEEIQKNSHYTLDSVFHDYRKRII